MRNFGVLITLVSIFACGAANAQSQSVPVAQSMLMGATWTGRTCLTEFLFEPDGQFAEYNDNGEDHHGQWEIDAGKLYLVYDDMSYQQAYFSNDGSFKVRYFDGPGVSHSCEFTSVL